MGKRRSMIVNDLSSRNFGDKKPREYNRLIFLVDFSIELEEDCFCKKVIAVFK